MPENTLTENQDSQIAKTTKFPNAEELSVLQSLEKIGFKLTHRMNQGALKRLMTFCQRHIGSLWIRICTYNLMQIYGIENFEKTDANRPVLLAANHRSFFDMYVVSTALFRRTKRDFQLYFPVRAKFFYSSPLGWLVNLVMGWFSMYPPFFRERGEAKKREFDKFSMRELVRLCSEEKPNVVGFHPEGERNFSDDQHSLLPAQPGVGAVIMKAQPQVIPVFVTGLGNDLPKQILGNWTGGEKVRVWFGSPVDLSEFYGKKDRLRTHKEISDFLMTKIGELAEADKNFKK